MSEQYCDYFQGLRDALRTCRLALLQHCDLSDKLALCNAIGGIGLSIECLRSCEDQFVLQGGPIVDHRALPADLASRLDFYADRYRTASSKASLHQRTAASALRSAGICLLGNAVEDALPVLPMRTAGFSTQLDPVAALCSIESQIFDIEISAAEVCAAIALRFPEIPIDFDLCLAFQCAEEGRHASLLAEEFTRMGGEFGLVKQDLRIWNQVALAESLEQAVCIEHILGEGYALGHDLHAAAKCRDSGLSSLASVHESLQWDEIMHVKDAISFLQSRRVPLDELICTFEKTCASEPPTGEWFRSDIREWVGFTKPQIERQRRLVGTKRVQP